MKITFVIPYACMSGGIRVLSVYARELQRRGHEVFVISQPYKSASFKSRIKAIINGAGWSAIRQEKMKSFFDGIDVPHRIIERRRPITNADVPDADVVVATWWETAEWVANLSLRKGAKAYFIQGHEVFDYLPKARVAATYLLPLHKIVVSKWLVDIMSGQYGDRDVSLVPNSVDLKQFYVEPRNKNKTPRVGFIYSTNYLKGSRTGLDAIAHLRRNIPDLRVVAFGHEDPSPDMPLPEAVEYIKQPHQDELRAIYGSCDVWLCSSVEEGFGLPILEAMACRCPVVSTAVGGSGELISEGQNGYVVPVRNHVALADGMAKILALSDAEWRVMSDAAYRRANAYTWDDAVTLFEEALQMAIGLNNKTRAYG